jgi:hypothetical protein
MKETKYYIIKESDLTDEVFNKGYKRTKDGESYQIVPFTENNTFKEEFINSHMEICCFGFDEPEEIV